MLNKSQALRALNNSRLSEVTISGNIVISREQATKLQDAYYSVSDGYYTRGEGLGLVCENRYVLGRASFSEAYSAAVLYINNN